MFDSRTAEATGELNMQVLVTGRREFWDRPLMDQAADWQRQQVGPPCSRVRRMAGEWTQSRGIEVIDGLPDWRRYRRAVGHTRNQQILVEHRNWSWRFQLATERTT
jgi:hypothetical protein